MSGIALGALATASVSARANGGTGGSGAPVNGAAGSVGAGGAPGIAGGSPGMNDDGGGGGGGTGAAGGTGGGSGGGIGGMMNSMPGVNAPGTDGGGGGGAGGANGNGMVTLGGPGGAGGAGAGNGGGGGGGAGGFGAIETGTFDATSPVTGGQGGAGGAGAGAGTGGNGGDGGIGVLLGVAMGVETLTNTAGNAIAGGAGGQGGGGAEGGSGGRGGTGVSFTAAGGTLMNAGAIMGGAGGVDGADPSSGNSGGIGVIGAGLTIVNQGTIQGGETGSLGGHANAVTFTGGTNYLVVQVQLATNGTATNGTATNGGIDGQIAILGGSLTIGSDLNGDTPDSIVDLIDPIVGTGSVVAAGGQTLNLGGQNSYTGGTTIKNGTVLGVSVSSLPGNPQTSSIGTGELFFNGSSAANPGTLKVNLQPYQGRSMQLTNTIEIDDSQANINTNGSTLSLTGTITGAGMLYATGNGTLTLSGLNNYAGGTTVTGYTTLQIVPNPQYPALPSASIGTGALTLDTGTVQAIKGSTTLNNQINITGGGGTIDAGGNGFTLAGNIVDAQPPLTKGGQVTFQNSNSNIILLTGTNTYSGPTSIAANAIVQAGSAGAISSASNFMVNGTLDLGGYSAEVASLASNSTSGSITTSGSGAAITLTINTTDPSGSANFEGTISDNPSATPTPQQIAVLMNGPGKQVFSGTNTYSDGTTITNTTTTVPGTLELAHVDANNVFDAAGSGQVVVQNGLLELGVYSGTNAPGACNNPNAPCTLTNALMLQNPNGAAIVAATPGIYATLTGPITFDSVVAQFGTSSDTGTLIFAPTSITTPATLEIAGGTLQAAPGNPMLGMATAQAGSTQIDGPGTLDFNGNSATIASLTGSGTLTNSAGATTSIESGAFTGSITGGGAVAKTGPGVLDLFGNSSYMGGTDLSGGTLAINQSTSLGTGPISIAGGTTLQFAGVGITLSNTVTLNGPGASTLDTGANTATVSGSISGGGGLLKAGGGTLVLSNGNTYGGGTALTAGTIAVGASTALGTGALAMADGTTLAFAANNLTLGNAVTLTGTGTVDTGANVAGLSGPVSGTGGLAKVGTGALVLTGTNGYTGGTLVETGKLAIGNAAAAGSGTVSLDAGTTLAFDASLTFPNAIAFPQVGDPTIDTGPNTVVISNSISGPGDLTKIGTGTLILTAANTYTGATNVDVGTLIVTGSTVNSAATVNNGAVLGGSGTIGGLNLQAGGVLAPGALTPYSTLHVAGNAVIANGSTFAVQVNPSGQTDALAVTGTATVNGGTLQVTAANGIYSTSTIYPVLTAGGGRNGTFAYLSSNTNFAFLAPTLTYTANGVDLAFSRTTTTPAPTPTNPNPTPVPVSFASVAATPNQAATATAIDGLGRGPLYNAVLSQTVAGARQAFESASGEAHASAMNVATQDARLFGNIVLDRLWNIASPNGSDAVDALGQFGSTTLPALVRCYAPVDGQAERSSNYIVWGQGIGSFGHLGGDGNASAVTQSLGGVAAGIDTRIEAPQFSNWRVGLAAGYTSDDFSTRNGLGSGNYQNVFGGLYAGARYGAVDLRFGGSYGGSWTNVNRTVAFSGFSEAEHSNYGGDTGQVFGEVGYRFAVNRSVVEPVVGAAFTHVGSDRFREDGGAAALVGGSESTNVGTTTVGFRSEAQLVAGLPVVARLFIAWQHAFGDVDPRSTVAFAAGSTPFTVAGAPIDRDSALAEVGLEYRATAAMTVALSYLGQIGPRDDNNAVKGRLDYRF